MKKPLIIISGIIGVLVGLGFVFPAVALMRTTGGLPNASVGLLLLGIALTIGGFAAACRGMIRHGA
jgi:hypothetical protein